ncbi:helix-hairpin-helix domain-containing protein [Lysinibacillus antri]|nr:helix-hairpin-helix domain-containing protein [Lysinibacillus antri]
MHLVKKYAKTVLFPGMVCIGILYFILQQNDSSGETLEITTIPQEQIEQLNSEVTKEVEEPTNSPVMVDVKGAVHFPGVYELTTEDRVIDAIQLAGGYIEEADTKMINHAQKLVDEMVLYIPKKGEDVETIPNGQVAVATNNQHATSSLIDINSADESQLTTLPGIGPSKAQAIISYREESGAFKSIEDLKKVTGIGDKTFERLREFIEAK